MNGLSTLVFTYDRQLYWFSNAMGAASFGAMCLFMSWMEAIPPNSLLLGVPFWLFLCSIAFLVLAGEIDDCKTEVDINRPRTLHSTR